MWVVFLLCILFALVAKGGRKIYVLIFMYPLSQVLRSNHDDPNRLAYLCLIVVILLAIDYFIKLIRRQEEINIPLSILCGLLIFCFVAPFNLFSFVQSIYFISQTLLVYFACLYRKDFRLNEIFILFFIGITTSLCLGFLAPGTRLDGVVWRFEGFSAPGPDLWRYGGLRGGPNNFAMMAILCLCIMFVLYINGSLKHAVYPCFAILLTCVALSGSQAFYMVLVGLLVLYFITWTVKSINFAFRNKDSKTRKKTYIYFIHLILLLTVCSMVYLGFNQSINTTLGRIETNVAFEPPITAPTDNGETEVTPYNFFSQFWNPESRIYQRLDRITTWRYGIWVSTIQQTFANIKNALFGFSIGSPYVGILHGSPGANPHSVYVDILFHAGLIGMGIFIAWALYMFIPTLKHRKFNWWNIFALLTFAVAIGSITALPFPLGIYLIILCPAFVYKPESKTAPPLNSTTTDSDHKQLSIVIPVYKVEPYLKKCIDSILSGLNGYENRYEIILVNDGSPDNCGNICDEYSEKHNHILVIHKENEGQGEARNVGIKKATGEYIAFIDSDDWVTSDIQRLFDYISSFPNTNVFCVGRTTVNKDEQTLRNITLEHEGIIDFTMPEFYPLIKHVTTVSKVIRRNFLIENNIFFTKGRLLEDFEHSMRLWEQCKEVYCTNINYYRHLKHQDSTMGNFSIKQLEHALLNVGEGHERIKLSNIPAPAKTLLKDFLGIHTYGSMYQALKTFDNKELPNLVAFLEANKQHLVFPFNYNLQSKIFWLCSKTIGIPATVNLARRLVYKKKV